LYIYSAIFISLTTLKSTFYFSLLNLEGVFLKLAQARKSHPLSPEQCGFVLGVFYSKVA